MGIDQDGLEFAWAQELWDKTTSGYNTAVKVVDETYTKTSPYINAAGRGLKLAVNNLAPYRPLTPEESKQIDDDGGNIGTLKKWPGRTWNGITSLPGNLIQVYTEGSAEQQIETAVGLVGTIAGMAKGKAPAKNIALASVGLNWSWKSTKTFGHIFLYHGQKVSIKSLADKAKTKNLASVGQWTDNEKAAEFIKGIYGNLIDGENTVEIPAGLGRAIKADGTVIENVTKAIIFKNSEGATNALKTAYPIL